MPDEKKKRIWSEVPWQVWGPAGVIFLIAIAIIIILLCNGYILSDINYIILSLTAAVAAPFGIWRMTITNKQANTNQQQADTQLQAHHTDSYIRAVEQLGKSNNKDEPNLEIRLGAVYALGKIAKESKAHFQSIIDLLCAYIRQHRKYNPEAEMPKKIERLRIDIEAALKIIGECRPQKGWVGEMPDLNEVDLQKMDLRAFNLKEFNLNHTHLEGVALSLAHLEGAQLRNARLEGAQLLSAHLEGAQLLSAHFEGANLCGAKLAEANNLIQEQINPTFGDSTTTLPDHIKRPQHWPKKELNIKEMFSEWEKWKEDSEPPK